MTSALITPARGRRGCKMAAEVLQEANKTMLPSFSGLQGTWEDLSLCAVHLYFKRINMTQEYQLEALKISHCAELLRGNRA